MKHPFLLVALCALLLNAGCALLPWGKKDRDSDLEADLDATEQLLYRNAQRSLRAGNYRQAITQLERLEAAFPFGRYAEQAQLEIIYAHYMSFNPDAARNAAERFIRLHPQHQSVDYAYYLLGLAAYHRNRGVFDRLVTSDVSRRDVSSYHEALADFATLLARFPNSAYAPDARQRMLHIRNILARSELQVAAFYMERGAFVAAANRARHVVENYSRTAAVPDALALLIEANWRLGMEDAANDALRVLAGNFPDYPAFDRNGDLVLTEQVRQRDRSWTNMITLGLIDRPDVPPPIRLRQQDALTAP
jgi:outer membrane protein assembly factor BamD